MSHFAVLITKTDEQDIESQLAPFDENREVPAYDRECWCIGLRAKNDARRQAERELNFNIEEVRKSYWSLPDELRNSERWAELTAEVNQLSDRYEQEHPQHNQPDPSCEECKGTGQYKSQYNPDSKWDWYVVGGRWMGALRLKEGALGELGEPGVFGNAAAENTADIAHVKDIDWEKTTPTYAVLHEGQWFEQGEMGWFGMAANEKPEDVWNKEFRQIVASLDPEDEVAVVDCHI